VKGENKIVACKNDRFCGNELRESPTMVYIDNELLTVRNLCHANMDCEAFVTFN